MNSETNTQEIYVCPKTLQERRQELYSNIEYPQDLFSQHKLSDEG